MLVQQKLQKAKPAGVSVQPPPVAWTPTSTRSKKVTRACKENGGFYLGSVGGPAAILAETNIKKVQVQEFPELGMEAVWKIDVVDFPAFVVVDDKGNDFFKKWSAE